jgi:hypothetical protein
LALVANVCDQPFVIWHLLVLAAMKIQNNYSSGA